MKTLRVDDYISIWLDVHIVQILMDGIWFYRRFEDGTFPEKEKVQHLLNIGRDNYMRSLFD